MKVVHLTQIEKMLNLFRWCAFDTEFPPNNRDYTFKSWIKKGLTTYLTFTENYIFQSFQSMQNRYDLRKNDFFRYLQVRHNFTARCKTTEFSVAETEFYKILKLAYGSRTHKLISTVYIALFTTDKDSTLYIKQKWEKEAEVVISEDSWGGIWRFQWSSTNSLS